jgi:hypothetical protein
MKCAEVKLLLSCYLDGAVTGAEMQAVGSHLEACSACDAEYQQMLQAQKLLVSVGRTPAPAGLASQLHAALAEEMASSQRRRWEWESLRVRWSNVMESVMLPATAGVVSAVLFFGLLIGYIAAPASVQASGTDDVPLALFTPAQLNSSPFLATIGNLDGSLVVETFVDAHGRVVDYKIISAPAGTEKMIPELDNMMIFTTFRPAMDLGRPTASRVVLSFSGINVRG